MRDLAGLSLVAASLLAGGAAPAATSSDDSQTEALRGLVTIHSSFPLESGESKDEDGVGVVVGVSATTVTVVTARHVVMRGPAMAENVKVQFTGEAREHPDILPDLRIEVAYLTLTVSTEVAKTLTFPFRVASQDMVRSLPCTGSPCRPQAVLITGDKSGLKPPEDLSPCDMHWDATELIFSTSVIHEGNSGSALLDGAGRLLGILQETDGHQGSATRFDLVLDSLKKHFPTDRTRYNRISGKSFLKLRGAPAGAQLLVDNEPIVDVRVTNVIASGEHHLSLHATGYEDTPSLSLTLADDQSTRCTVALASPVTRLRAQTWAWFLAGGTTFGLVGTGMLWKAEEYNDMFWNNWSPADYNRFNTWNKIGSIVVTAGGVTMLASLVWRLTGDSLEHSRPPSCHAEVGGAN